jgi:hypothetical protein
LAVTAEEAALAELGRIGRDREANEAQERRAVEEARRLGISWRAIADALGKSRNAVWEKYADLH